MSKEVELIVSFVIYIKTEIIDDCVVLKRYYSSNINDSYKSEDAAIEAIIKEGSFHLDFLIIKEFCIRKT